MLYKIMIKTNIRPQTQVQSVLDKVIIVVTFMNRTINYGPKYAKTYK